MGFLLMPGKRMVNMKRLFQAAILKNIHNFTPSIKTKTQLKTKPYGKPSFHSRLPNQQQW
jgi:hypothetical protein